jgi:hypothetical protein
VEGVQSDGNDNLKDDARRADAGKCRPHCRAKENERQLPAKPAGPKAARPTHFCNRACTENQRE